MYTNEIYTNLRQAGLHPGPPPPAAGALLSRLCTPPYCTLWYTLRYAEVPTRWSSELTPAEGACCWAQTKRARGMNLPGFEYATASGEAGCLRHGPPPRGSGMPPPRPSPLMALLARVTWHSGKQPREAEEPHPLRIRVARLPRPGRWERRPDLLLPCQHTYNRAAWR